jgi:hypothetical protein
MKGWNEPVARARVTVAVYLANPIKKKLKHTKKASWTNQYLTDDEELAFIHIVCIIGNMGHDVTHQEALSMIDDHIHQKVDECDAVECSKPLCDSQLTQGHQARISRFH